MTFFLRQRLQLLQEADRLRAGGMSQVQACEELGISTRALFTWYKWRERLAIGVRGAGDDLPPIRNPELDGPEYTLPGDKPRRAPAHVSLTTLSPAELVSELSGRCRAMIVVAELVDGTYLIELGADQKQYELLCALQALKAGARFKP